jgi:hypothetical protein
MERVQRSIRRKQRFILYKLIFFPIVLLIISFAMVAFPIFLTLQHKKQLTHDVYELEYLSEDVLPIVP